MEEAAETQKENQRRPVTVPAGFWFTGPAGRAHRYAPASGTVPSGSRNTLSSGGAASGAEDVNR